LSVEDKRNGNEIMGLGCFPLVAVAYENPVNHGVVRVGRALFAGTPNFGRKLYAILSILLLGSLPLAGVNR
jgi:hypothetical protein